jgi:uncharacterized membrane protein
MTQKTDTKRRVIRWALIVSLGVNLIVIGGAIGVFSRMQGHFDLSPPAGPASLYVRALSHDTRRSLGQAMRQSVGEQKHTSGHAHRQQFAQGYRDAIDLLRAEPFDQQALDQVMAEQAKFSQMRLDQARGVLVEHFASMSAEQRRDYATTLEQMIKRHD